jgi:hypothetical protein
MVEQLTLNQRVAGSSPARFTKTTNKNYGQQRLEQEKALSPKCSRYLLLQSLRSRPALSPKINFRCAPVIFS